MEYAKQVLSDAGKEAYGSIVEHPVSVALAFLVVWIIYVKVKHRSTARSVMTEQILNYLKGIWFPIAAMLVVFLVHLFWFSPKKMWEAERSIAANAIASVSSWSNKYETLKAEKEPSKPKEPDFSSIISATLAEYDKRFIEAMAMQQKSPDLAWQATISAMSPAAFVVTGANVSIKDLRAQQQHLKNRAEVGQIISERQAAEREAIGMASYLSASEALIVTLTNQIARLATDFGDTMTSTYIGMPRTFDSNVLNYAEIKLGVNRGWHFQIDLRADGKERYTEIYSLRTRNGFPPLVADVHKTTHTARTGGSFGGLGFRVRDTEREAFADIVPESRRAKAIEEVVKVFIRLQDATFPITNAVKRIQ